MLVESYEFVEFAVFAAGSLLLCAGRTTRDANRGATMGTSFSTGRLRRPHAHRLQCTTQGVYTQVSQVAHFPLPTLVAVHLTFNHRIKDIFMLLCIRIVSAYALDCFMDASNDF